MLSLLNARLDQLANSQGRDQVGYSHNQIESRCLNDQTRFGQLAGSQDCDQS
jgi:hypothetical protein